MKLDRKWLRAALTDISFYGQIGFQVVVPPIILCLISIWLKNKLSLGNWIIILAIIIGLLSAFISLYRICRIYLAKIIKQKDEKENTIISYRKHS